MPLKLWVKFQTLLSDDHGGGERDMISTLTIAALIIVPLLILIIAFGKQISDWGIKALADLKGQTAVPSK